MEISYTDIVLVIKLRQIFVAAAKKYGSFVYDNGNSVVSFFCNCSQKVWVIKLLIQDIFVAAAKKRKTIFVSLRAHFDLQSQDA